MTALSGADGAEPYLPCLHNFDTFQGQFLMLQAQPRSLLAAFLDNAHEIEFISAHTPSSDAFQIDFDCS
jgi:hypothetical protein